MADPKLPTEKTDAGPAGTTKADSKPDDNLDDNGDPWRHPPVAPKDEGALESFGRSISETVTGPLKDRDGKAKG